MQYNRNIVLACAQRSGVCLLNCHLENTTLFSYCTVTVQSSISQVKYACMIVLESINSFLEGPTASTQSAPLSELPLKLSTNLNEVFSLFT